MEQTTSKILYSYWNDVRADRPAPRRFDIEPARIASILPETFILERMDARTYRFRLAGTRICEQFGREFRGSDFLDLWTDADRKVLENQFSSMCQNAGVGILTLEGKAADGRTARFESTLLPLFHVQPVVSRFLGAMSAVCPPAWLGNQRIVSHRLLSYELMWPDGRPHAAIKAMKHQSPFLANVRGARLVKQDRRRFRVYDGGLSLRDPKSS